MVKLRGVRREIGDCALGWGAGPAGRDCRGWSCKGWLSYCPKARFAGGVNKRVKGQAGCHVAAARELDETTPGVGDVVGRGGRGVNRLQRERPELWCSARRAG